MERMTVIGRRKLDFTPKGQSDPVTGCHLFCTHKDEHVDGLMAERIFFNIRSELYGQVMSLKLPCEIDVNVNRYGKPESFTVVEGK